MIENKEFILLAFVVIIVLFLLWGQNEGFANDKENPLNKNDLTYRQKQQGSVTLPQQALTNFIIFGSVPVNGVNSFLRSVGVPLNYSSLSAKQQAIIWYQVTMKLREKYSSAMKDIIDMLPKGYSLIGPRWIRNVYRIAEGDNITPDMYQGISWAATYANSIPTVRKVITANFRREFSTNPIGFLNSLN